jgi:hypothetical protein
MSIQLEIERFRSDLYRAGTDSQEAQTICDALLGDINEMLVELVSNNVSSALDYALEIGADEFVDDIQVLPDYNGVYTISSHSGNLDYSKDAQEMLPNLLKNAEVSKDGSRHKVIPMQKKDVQVQQSMFNMLQARKDAQDAARDALRKHTADKRLGVAAAIREDLSRQLGAIHTSKQATSTRSSDVEFRTASDKQDPHTSWVIPAKQADMTDYIRDLNRQLVDASLAGISNIIDSYYSSYVRT